MWGKDGDGDGNEDGDEDGDGDEDRDALLLGANGVLSDT